MSLKHNVTLESFGQSVTVPDTIIRISNIKGNKSSCSFTVFYFIVNSEGGQEMIHEKSFWFKPSVSEGSENFIKQAYEHLKTLPEFADAIDA
jgi:hypothetical protein